MNLRWDDNHDHEQRDWEQKRPIKFWDAMVTILVMVALSLLAFAIILNHLNLI